VLLLSVIAHHHNNTHNNAMFSYILSYDIKLFSYYSIIGTNLKSDNTYRELFIVMKLIKSIGVVKTPHGFPVNFPCAIMHSFKVTNCSALTLNVTNTFLLIKEFTMNNTHRRHIFASAFSIAMGIGAIISAQSVWAETLVLASNNQVQNWQNSRDSAKPVLVEFFEDGCGWCGYEQPVLDKLSDAGLNVVQVNAPKAPDFAAENKVRGYPTLVLLTPEGKSIRWVGYHNLAETKAWLKKNGYSE
jgi:thiol-disulfide isomerase/thioredoxin